jgi:hypothetical protein
LTRLSVNSAWIGSILPVNNGELAFDTFMQLGAAPLEKWKSTIGSHLTGPS